MQHCKHNEVRYHDNAIQRKTTLFQRSFYKLLSHGMYFIFRYCLCILAVFDSEIYHVLLFIWGCIYLKKNWVLVIQRQQRCYSGIDKVSVYQYTGPSIHPLKNKWIQTYVQSMKILLSGVLFSCYKTFQSSPGFKWSIEKNFDQSLRRLTVYTVPNINSSLNTMSVSSHCFKGWGKANRVLGQWSKSLWMRLLLTTPQQFILQHM